MSFETFDFNGPVSSSTELVEALAREGFVKRQGFEQLRRAAAEDMLSLISAVRGGDDQTLLREAFAPRYEYVQQEVARRFPNVVRLRETMSTGDFSAYLTTDLLNIMLWGGFTTLENPVMGLVKKTSFVDFKTIKRLMIDGDGTPFEEDKSDGHAPAPQGVMTPVAPITYEPKSYSKKMSISWKALWNDNFGIFDQMTDWLLTGWKNTVWDLITKKYWDANGPHASMYNAGNTNLVTPTYGATRTNPPLDFQAIAEGYTVLLKQLGPDGEPIDFPGSLTLVVGPALAITAKAIKNSVQNQLSILGGANNSSTGFPEVRLNVGPGVIPDFDIIVDKRIPKVVTTGTRANTSWLLVYSPSAQQRPNVELGMMTGFDTPTVFQRAPDTMRPGGGVDARMGAFDSGQLDYKSVLVMGSAYGNCQNTVGSNGTGA